MFRKSSKKISGIRKREIIMAYIFLLPSLAGFLFFIIGPVIAGLSLSFFKWDILNPPKFAGLTNYIELFHDKIFRVTFINTCYFTAGTVAGTLVISLALAVLLEYVTNRYLTIIFRSIYIFPMIISLIVTALVWGWMLDSSFGVINYILSLLGLSPIPWLTSTKWAMPAMILLTIWQSLGFNFLVFTAGLAGIPSEYYEAAKIDGANNFQQFLHITLPGLSPSIFFVVIISCISSFQGFTQFYALTAGGPGDATRTIVYYLYDVAFRYFRMGSGAAIAVILFIIIASFTLLQWRTGKRWVFYG